MRNIQYQIVAFACMLSIASCSNDNDSESAPSYVGDWKGKTEIQYIEGDESGSYYIDVEYVLLKNGRFVQKFSGIKETDEDKGDAYDMNRGDYAFDNDTLLLYFDYMEKYGGSASDAGPYADTKDSDGTWYRLNLNNDGTSWDVISDAMSSTYSPQFIKVTDNKYKIKYLYGEEIWMYKGKFIVKFSSANKLTFYSYPNAVELYTLSR